MAGRIHGHTRWELQLCAGRRAAVAAKARRAVTGDGADQPADRIDPTDALIVPISNEQMAGCT